MLAHASSSGLGKLRMPRPPCLRFGHSVASSQAPRQRIVGLFEASSSLTPACVRASASGGLVAHASPESILKHQYTRLSLASRPLTASCLLKPRDRPRHASQASASASRFVGLRRPPHRSHVRESATSWPHHEPCAHDSAPSGPHRSRSRMLAIRPPSEASSFASRILKQHNTPAYRPYSLAPLAHTASRLENASS